MPLRLNGGGDDGAGDGTQPEEHDCFGSTQQDDSLLLEDDPPRLLQVEDGRRGSDWRLSCRASSASASASAAPPRASACVTRSAVAEVGSSGITLITLGCNVRRYVLQDCRPCGCAQSRTRLLRGKEGTRADGAHVMGTCTYVVFSH